jgi:hypothetical protein
MRYFRQVSDSIDVGPLLDQIDRHPDLWSTETEWTRKTTDGGFVLYDTENVVLRYNGPRLPEDKSWDRPALQLLPAAKPIIAELMAAIPGEHLGKIVITRLRPGSRIDWHTDMLPIGWPVYWHRFQIPLRCGPGVRFIVGGDEADQESLPMEPGTAWWFNNQVRHGVFNDSNEDRISMLTDIKPWDYNAGR